MSQATFTGGLGYEGKVTLTLKSNNRVLKSKTYKNKGTAQLFKFLGYCLIGAYEEAKPLLPNKILLLHNSSPMPDNTADPTLVEPRSALQPLTQAPTIVSEGSQVKVMYSFEVSRAAIARSTSSSTASNKTFNQVALYGDGAELATEFSAYYFLKDAHNNWDNIDPVDWSATTVLLIEWVLTISNTNIDTNTTEGE